MDIEMQVGDEKNEEERLDTYGKTEQKLVTDKLEYHVMDLRAFRKKKKPAGELADWLNLLVGNKEEVKMAAKKNKELKEAVKVVEEMGQDPETRELYWLIQKGRYEENTRILNAIEEGREQARKEFEAEKAELERLIQKGRYEENTRILNAIDEEKIEIAKKLLNMKMSIKDIATATGMTEEEIKKLKT